MRKTIIAVAIILIGNSAVAQVEFEENYFPLFDSIGNMFYIKISDTATYKNMQPGSRITLYTENLDSIGYYRYDALRPKKKALVWKE